jgi:hypothetical protein
MKKLFLLVLLIEFSIFFTNLNIAYADDPCFKQNEKFQSKLVKQSADPPAPGDIDYIKVPDEVALGNQYNLSGSWAWNYSYNKGMWSVNAGWVNDESDLSTTFFADGKFDKKFFTKEDKTNTSGGRKFNIVMDVPKDTEAVKHNFLKIQIFISASGDSKTFFQSYIYKIPITDKVYGKVCSADADYNSGALLFTPESGAGVSIQVASIDIITNKYSDGNGCFDLSIPGDDRYWYDLKIINNHSSDYDKFTRLVFKIEKGSKINYVFPEGINKQHKDAWNELNTVKIKQDILWDSYPIEIPWIHTYTLEKTNIFFSKCKSIDGEWSGIESGIESDSLRADFLARLVLAEKATNPIFYQFQKVNGELMKNIYATVLGIFFVKELSTVGLKVAEATKADKVAVEIAKLITKYGTNLVSSVLNFAIDRIPDKKLKSNLKLSVQGIGTTILTIAEKSKLGSIWKAFQKEGLGNIAVLAGNLVLLPAYVLVSDPIVDSRISSAFAGYPSESLKVKGTLKQSVDKVLGPKGEVKLGEDASNEVKNFSRDLRNGSKILDAISAVGLVGGGLVAVTFPPAAVALPVIVDIVVALQVIKFGMLLTALSYCITTEIIYPLFAYSAVDQCFNPENVIYTPTVSDNYPSKGGWDASFKKTNKYDSPLGLEHPSKKYISNINSISQDYLKLVDSAINKAQNGTADELTDAYCKMIYLEDSLYTYGEMIRNTIMTSYDTIFAKDTTFKSRFLNYFDFTHLVNSHRMLLDMRLLNYLADPKKTILDTAKMEADSVKKYLSGYVDTSMSLTNVASQYPSLGYVILTEKTEFNDTLDLNKQYTMTAKIKNIGGSRVDSLKVKIETDKFRIDSQNEYLLVKLDPNEEAQFQWQFTITDTSLFVCDYNIDLDAVSGMTSANTWDYLNVHGKIVNGIAGLPYIKETEIKVIPNPINTSSQILVTLPKDSKISVNMYDLFGNKLENLGEGYYNQGEYKFIFDSKDYPSAVYFIRVEGIDFVKTQLLQIMK